MNLSNSRGGNPKDAARLAKEMLALANLVDAATVATFAIDAVFSAAQRLLESLEVMTEAATTEQWLDHPGASDGP